MTETIVKNNTKAAIRRQSLEELVQYGHDNFEKSIDVRMKADVQDRFNSGKNLKQHPNN